MGGNSTREELLAVGRELRARHWDQQKQAGIDLLPVGDFAWYDHVLTTSLLLGNVPPRHQNNDGSVDIDTLFRIGRGRAPTGEPAAAAEMTKWFNTNYHYMVPEFVKGQQFKLTDAAAGGSGRGAGAGPQGETCAAGAGYLPVAG